MRSDRTAQLAAQVTVFGISVGGYVALSIWGEATAEYVALVGPVLGAAFLMTRLGRQDDVLGEIHENTNGVLTQRIRDAVHAELDEHDGHTGRDEH